MESKKTNLSEYNLQEIPDGKNFRIAIVVSEWNTAVTGALYEGAYKTLLSYQVSPENIITKMVPGAFELPVAASLIDASDELDAIICLGCIIQGETPHFDFISQAVAQGIMQLSLQIELPVVFGVLTTLTLEQAWDRAGGKHGNKGVEAAVTALKMAHLSNELFM